MKTARPSDSKEFKMSQTHKFNNNNKNSFAITFHWIKNPKGKIDGFLASAELNTDLGMTYGNIYAKDERDFLQKYPTLKHLIKGFALEESIGGSKNEQYSIKSIINNCDLYPLIDEVPVFDFKNPEDVELTKGITGYQNTTLPRIQIEAKFKDETACVFDYEKAQKKYDFEISFFSLTFLRICLRDGTDDGFAVETQLDGDVTFTDMLYYKSEEAFKQEFPTLKSFALELAQNPIWAGTSQFYGIDFLYLNQGLYKLTKASPCIELEELE